jgi:hypothetical protein
MPRARTDINWPAVKVMWLNGQHTSDELGAIFGISADGIRGRAFRERWNELKRIKHDKTAVLPALPEVRIPARPSEIVERAEKLRGPASFRRRVAEQAERIIDKLEVKDPDSMRELDNFAEVLVKTEKVGARAYGIDSEESRPVINIGVLSDSDGFQYETLAPGEESGLEISDGQPQSDAPGSGSGSVIHGRNTCGRAVCVLGATGQEARVR